ncbi:Hypothetical predicted protein [Paramuricea clavata]|uniref:Uncharacterized protein n=1 Tax=Paramuricea clavata TaxID=317549 RepID=A0A7D9IC13_PARCT|nr:Hypothetical predicted protein [Paramuricea clavata]
MENSTQVNNNQGAFSRKNNFSTKTIGERTMENSTQASNSQGAFSRKNNFSTKSIGKKKMSKAARMREEQHAKIREQFLRDLFTKDRSESGFSIFDEKEPEPKRYRSEVKIQMDKHKAINAEEPKKHRSEVKIQVNKPKVRPIPLPRKKLQDTKPTPPPRIRKPVKKMREVEQQPQVITPEEHEIDPFGTDLQMPGHRKIETAANGSVTPLYSDPLNQMTSSRQVVRSILVNELKKMGGLKYTETLKVKMSKEVGNGKTKKDSVYFKSKTGTATNFEDIEKTAAFNQQTVLARIETFQNLGSNWIIMNIESHYINIAMYKPLAGSSYMELPKDISNSKCGLINIRNDDNMCFMWCHVRHLRPKTKRATTITQNDRDFELNLDYSGIEFPVKISDIGKIEKKNKINISVLYYRGRKQFYPIRISKGEHEDHMELLLLGDDFESILVPNENTKSNTCSDESYTERYQTHQACSFGLKTVCHYNDSYSGEYVTYVEKDAAYVFLKTVIREATRCRSNVNNLFKKKMIISPEQEKEFLNAADCSICGELLGEDRVRDHCHITGHYREAAHNICNLKCRISWKVPVVFHNLRGYESHLIMQEIEELAGNLSPEDFRIVGKRWQREDFKLVTQKGIFPYELMDDISKLQSEGLPSKDKFYSTLYEYDVSDEDYQTRAQRVWSHFNMKTMRDYHDLYLETDVLLLADVFENFRRTCMESYELDPAHYVSAPGLSWDAFLKKVRKGN